MTLPAQPPTLLRVPAPPRPLRGTIVDVPATATAVAVAAGTAYVGVRLDGDRAGRLTARVAAGCPLTPAAGLVPAARVSLTLTGRELVLTGGA